MFYRLPGARLDVFFQGSGLIGSRIFMLMNAKQDIPVHGSVYPPVGGSIDQWRGEFAPSRTSRRSATTTSPSARLVPTWPHGRVNASFAVLRIEQDNVAQLVSGWSTEGLYKPIKGSTTKSFCEEPARQAVLHGPGQLRHRLLR